MGVFLFSRKDGETQRGIESSPLRLSCFARVFNFLMVLRWSTSTVFICFFLVTYCSSGANISIGHKIKLKICGLFPRESAGKKLTQITVEKPRR
jgi:hypothetical protein